MKKESRRGSDFKLYMSELMPPKPHMELNLPKQASKLSIQIEIEEEDQEDEVMFDDKFTGYLNTYAQQRGSEGTSFVSTT